jgi:Family of unknown function (DUF6959)
MTKIEVESFSGTTNATVVRLPGRQFPGIVVQGDSLKILLDSASEVAQLSRGTNVPGLEESAEEVVRLLNGYRQAYEEALSRHNQSLPY